MKKTSLQPFTLAHLGNGRIPVGGILLYYTLFLLNVNPPSSRYRRGVCIRIILFARHQPAVQGCVILFAARLPQPHAALPSRRTPFR